MSSASSGVDMVEVSRVLSGARPPRVLLAEDDLQMRALVADALRDEGFEVIEAADARHLLERVASWAGGYELVVSDVRMPNVDGFALVERLRAARSDAPVILMTAFGDDATRTRATALGATMFDKPFKLEKLRAIARRVASEWAARLTATHH
jgi:DNA-binding response OmpR family regulator